VKHHLITKLTVGRVGGRGDAARAERKATPGNPSGAGFVGSGVSFSGNWRTLFLRGGWRRARHLYRYGSTHGDASDRQAMPWVDLRCPVRGGWKKRDSNADAAGGPRGVDELWCRLADASGWYDARGVDHLWRRLTRRGTAPGHPVRVSGRRRACGLARGRAFARSRRCRKGLGRGRCSQLRSKSLVAALPWDDSGSAACLARF
jgi:hypothetical protein